MRPVRDGAGGKETPMADVLTVVAKIRSGRSEAASRARKSTSTVCTNPG